MTNACPAKQSEDGTMKPDFQTSFNRALSNEGFISNNKNDHGGFVMVQVKMDFLIKSFCKVDL